MEPEKAMLRQTGLSIKNSWQQFMAAWVQPELDINERLFALKNGNSGVFGFEEKPFQKSIEEVLDFSEKLCFVGWPFEFDAAVQQRQPESGLETISGRRPSFLPPQKKDTGRPAEDGSKQSPLPPGSTREFLKPGEKGNAAIETKGNIEEQLVPGRNPEVEFKGENEKAVSGPLVKTNHPSPETGSGMQEVAETGSFHATDFAGPTGNTDSRKKEQNESQEPGMLAGNGEQNMDGQESSNRKTVFRNPELADHETPGYSTNQVARKPAFEYPEPSEIKKSHAFQPVYVPQAAEPEFISAEPLPLPAVKTLKSLGAWLQENSIGQLPGTEITENKPPAAFSDFNTGNSREDSHPAIFEAYPEANNPFEFSHFNEHDHTPQNSPKPISGFFEDPFTFPGETSNMPDSEDFIRELTEQLNREFKRFYGP